MGQASSAQREPSMEEILASIRRIIEETDSAPGAEEAVVAHKAAPAEADSEPQYAPARDESEVSAFRDAFQDEPQEAPSMKPAASVAKPEPQSQPFTLSDVQRRLVRERDEKDAPASVTEEFSTRGKETVSVDAHTPEPAKPEGSVLMSLAERRVDAVADETAMDTDAGTTATPVVEPETPKASVPPAPAAAKDRPAIMSAAIGRQVAGSFEELKEAFTASRQRSFDEMAEEMMRPMLQDWLDNNLPQLVERLVREEIERIARGG